MRSRFPHEAAAVSKAKASTSGTTAGASAPGVKTEETPLHDVLRQKTGYEPEAGAALDPEALSAELDELNFSGGSDSDDIGGGDDDLDALEDDDIDLR